ncbi:MAG TPA: DUF4097 family beta strand repeat-containing protein [Bryobacteraceae bacterium]|jgi:DUF4097 and DUF4098 domain-containing protein YvlB|nr:DUF4097 family beta strand repeat-containing protein [Bryobacteraceae bacterium]
MFKTGSWLAVGLLLLAGSMRLQADEEGCRANHNHGWWGDGASFAQVRQERLPAAAFNSVDPGQNGSIRIHGWSDADVLVKACIQTSASNDSEARDLASQVKITQGAGHIEASGPSSHHNRSWSVSYEIWMPRASETKLEAENGSISVDGLAGRLRFHTTNGSVELRDVGSDVSGDTTNGSITLEVAQVDRSGSGLRFETTNGDIRLEFPENFAARVQASTTNGTIKTDFPVTVNGEIGRHVEFTLGQGGPEVEAKTTNGSVHITRRG